jgi:hypothetical protein
MMHKIIIISTLIASAFGRVAAVGEGSVRGLGIFGQSAPQTITITVELDDSVGDVLTLLQGPILDALNGEFSTLTGNDADTGTMEVSLAADNSGGRRLGTYSYNGGCTRRCKSDNRDRRALATAGFRGAVRSAVLQWCQDNGKVCKRNVIKGISYDLSE